MNPSVKAENRVLIVDDAQDFVATLVDILELWDYKIETAYHSASALTKCKAFEAQVALVDVRLGHEDGLTLLSQLKAINPRLMCIMMTAFTDIDTVTSTLKHGAYDYLHKPFAPEDLQKTLERCFEKINLEEEKAALQLQLQQAQKMEALGTMAGGIAHDFNNILAIIFGNTELALQKIQSPALQPGLPANTSALEANLNQVLQASTRGIDLVKQILLFSRQKKQVYETIDPIKVVDESLTLLRSLIPSTVTIHQQLDDACGLMGGDPTQLHQIIMNLCSNSAQAMNDTGEIQVKLESVELSDAEVKPLSDKAAGRYVRLTIADSGKGISDTIMARIFDPFFTTKAIGEGTGIGLAAVHSIVKNHRGHISVDSQVGVGTRFRIDFPQAQGTLPRKVNTEAPRPGQQQRILFIDDEVAVAELGREFLQQLGYRVVTQTDSTQALKLFQSTPDAFDLVITDHCMPRLSGLELAEKLLKIRADIPIMLCSGYCTEKIEQKIKAIGIREYCVKPVLKETLSQIVPTLLKAGQGVTS